MMNSISTSHADTTSHERAYALLQAVREIAAALFSEPQSGIPYDHITKRLSLACSVDYAALFLPDEATDDAQLRIPVLIASATKQSATFQDTAEFLKGLLSSSTLSEPKVIDLTAKSPTPHYSGDQQGDAVKLQTLLLAPIRTTNGNTGTVVVGSMAAYTPDPLETEALAILGWQISSALRESASQEKLAVQKEQLQQTTSIDPLTGLKNRQALTEIIGPAIEKAKSGDGQLSILMMDTDHLKRVNDRFGTQVGDEALQKIAEVIQGGIRGWDIAARFGGDEFCVLLPATGGIGAVAVAERLRDQISSLSFGDTDPISLTACIGVACLSSLITNVEELFTKADKSLMEGKSFGGNQVIIDWDMALEGVEE